MGQAKDREIRARARIEARAKFWAKYRAGFVETMTDPTLPIIWVAIATAVAVGEVLVRYYGHN